MTIDVRQTATRPWYRLHLSTWLLQIPAIVVVLLLEIPGDEPAGLIFEGSEMIHGFPTTYLRLCRDDWIYTEDTVEFAPMDPWKLNGQSKANALSGLKVIGAETLSFSPLGLAIDVVFAIALVGGFCALLEWRRRRRKLYQFTLRELLAVTTVVAGGFGWWMLQRGEERRLFEHLKGRTPSEALGPIESPSMSEIQLIPRFPRWARDLVGDERLVSLGLNRPRVELRWTLDNHDDARYCVQRNSSSFLVKLVNDRSPEDWDTLAELNPLERLVVGDYSSNLDQSRIEQFTNLRELIVGWNPGYKVTRDGLARLVNLKRLELLYLGSCFTDDSLWRERFSGQLTAGGDDTLDFLRGLTNLRSIRLGFQDEERITRIGMASLASLQHLESLGLENVTISEGALEPLVQLKELRRLDIVRFEPTATDLAVLSRLPKLKRVTVWRTSTNRAALDAFMLAHPDMDFTVRGVAN